MPELKQSTDTKLAAIIAMLQDAKRGTEITANAVEKYVQEKLAGVFKGAARFFWQKKGLNFCFL